MSATAIVVWTDDEPEGDCDEYSLYSPDIEKNDPDQVKSYALVAKTLAEQALDPDETAKMIAEVVATITDS